MNNSHDPLTVLHGDELPVHPIRRSRPGCAHAWNPLRPYPIERKELS